MDVLLYTLTTISTPSGGKTEGAALVSWQAHRGDSGGEGEGGGQLNQGDVVVQVSRVKLRMGLVQVDRGGRPYSVDLMQTSDNIDTFCALPPAVLNSRIEGFRYLRSK